MTRVGDVLQGSLLEEQINLETEAVSRGVARYRRLAQDAIERNDGSSLKPAERLMVYWIPVLKRAIQEEQRMILAGKPGVGRGIYGPVLLRLDADRLSVIALHEMLSRCMAKPGGETVLKMSYAIGSTVLAEIHHDMMRGDRKANNLDELDRKFKNITPSRINQWAKKTLKDSLWDRKVCTHIGAILINHVLLIATMGDWGEDIVPAFLRKLIFRNGRSTGVLILSDEAQDLIEAGHIFRQSIRARFLPMILQPYPWSEDSEGGYTRIRTPFISKPTRDQREALKGSDLRTLHEGLNAINATPWKMNTRMLDLQREIFQSGGGAGIPKPDLVPMPPKPGDIDTNEESLARWKSQAHDVHSQNAKLKGARIEYQQRAATADMFRGYNQVFYPCQLDFRFRHYPIPATAPHWHGPDQSRACMLFGKAVPLTDDGMRWLHIQTANHFGEDKLSFDERVSWTENHMAQLKEWGERPLDTIHEWGQVENPLQFMNCCWALFDPELASHLPGHVDGSNNVNQHYGAISRDPITCEKVNMTKRDRPHDPYHDAVILVAQDLKRRADAGCQLSAATIHHMKIPSNARKLCKRPAMTRNYNCTRVGARNQVYMELTRMEVPRDVRRAHAKHFGDIVYDQVAELFPASTKLMSWLEVCCRAMCKAQPNRSVSWPSPLGVPVVQPYRNPRKFRINTIVQDILLGHRDVDTPVSLARQIQGIAANWIHTQDAAHAMFTAIETRGIELDTAFVHDSDWAHLSNMTILGEILREQFVLMHETDLATMSYEYWLERYPGLDLPAPPARGDFDLNQVLEAEYFFG